MLETVGDGTETSAIGIKLGSDGTTIDTGIDLDDAVCKQDIVTTSGAKIFSGSAANGDAVYAE